MTHEALGSTQAPEKCFQEKKKSQRFLKIKYRGKGKVFRTRNKINVEVFDIRHLDLIQNLEVKEADFNWCIFMGM